MDEKILKFLPELLSQIVRRKFNTDQLIDLEEIRLRVGRQAQMIFHNREVICPEYTFERTDATKLLAKISEYSVYRLEEELRNGYITIQGGHRIGISGKVAVEGGQVKAVTHVSSFNIRVASERKGAAKHLLSHIAKGKLYNTLLIGPPKSGKTTILRDIIRTLSDGTTHLKPSRVALVDERSEIAASYNGVPQHDVGKRTDVMSDCPKAEGMMMMVRSMSPEVLAVDEIGREEDVVSLLEATHTGVQVICSVHGYSIDDMKRRPNLAPLIADEVFNRYIVLSPHPKPGHVLGVFNERFEQLSTNVRGMTNEVDRSDHDSVHVHVGRNRYS
ncbi:stage III sporulation protein AA [Alkalibacillus haloalkaliphilus]|uniref:Stage III sporulation protein AA n=1 Tax=Alkalibacillus haloalkaliphilus TaxID=94136 RepID=A0A511W3F7_9BACI|nr:stage III sporulation protein AA [Alkalibacillus haloalkaliphilus]GEN45291.1 stage III sporulation protein AA [Alkalibacillus haloalkaliphilus]